MATQVVKMCVDSSALAKEQVELMDRHAGSARAAWNWALGIRNEWQRRIDADVLAQAEAILSDPVEAGALAHANDLAARAAAVAAGKSEADAEKAARASGKIWVTAARASARTRHGAESSVSAMSLDKLFSRAAGVAMAPRDPSKVVVPTAEWLTEFIEASEMSWAWWGDEDHGVNRFAVVSALRNLDASIKMYWEWMKKPVDQRPWTAKAKRFAAQGLVKKRRSDGRPDGWPKFKAMALTTPAFAIFNLPSDIDKFLPGGRRIKIPNVGTIRVHGGVTGLRTLIRGGGTPKSARFTHVGGRWYVTINVDVAAERSAPTTKRQRDAGAVGVDLGVTKHATFSDGSRPQPNARTGRQWKPRVDRAQHQLARTAEPEAQEIDGRLRKVRSVGRVRAQKHLAKVKHLEALDRQRVTHDLTKRLAVGYETIVIEDLNVAGMTAAPAPKPDPNEPGHYLPNGAAAKAGLNREILDVSFGEFRRQLEYKTRWYGSETIAVDPAYTSQTCNRCGHIAAGNRHGEDFLCLDCGHTADADVNAARNILARGLIK